MVLHLLLLLSFYLPFQVALNPAEGIDMASIRVFIILLFFLWLGEGLKNKKLELKGGGVSILIFTFLFLSGFSLFFSENIIWAGRKLLYLFSVFPIYWVSSAIIVTGEKMEKIIKFLLWGCLAVAVLGILQFLLQFVIGLRNTYSLWANYISIPFLGHNLAQAVRDYPSWLVNLGGYTTLRATAVFPDPHIFSFFLGLIMPLSLGYFFRKKESIYLFIFLVIFVADILTFSRGGYLGLLAAGIVLIVSFWQKIDKKYKMAGLFLGIFLTLGLLVFPSPVSRRFQSSFNLKEGSNQGRLEMWKKAAEAISYYPFTGVGLGNYPLFVKPIAGYREPIYAHNTYLDIAAETGIPSALVWVGILGTAMVRFRRLGEKNILFFSCFLSLVVFFAHSLAETAIYSPVVLALFLIIISFSNIDDEGCLVA